MCCWVAAVGGAGLLKSEDILEGAARLRISDDLEFDEQNLFALMNETKSLVYLLYPLYYPLFVQHCLILICRELGLNPVHLREICWTRYPVSIFFR